VLGALALLLGCRAEADQDAYVGNWSSTKSDILITPSKGIFMHVRSGSTSNYSDGMITGWKGTSPIVEALPGFFSLERTIEIDKAPYRDGDTWKMHWDGTVLVRVPDHAPFATSFSSDFDLEPSGWDLAPILAKSTLPKDRQTLVGHWRGLSLDLVIAHDGQVRGETLGRLGSPIFDGVIDEWTEGGFRIQKRGGSSRRFAIEAMPEPKDGRSHMMLNGAALVKVYDFTPVGMHGNWQSKVSKSALHSVLDEQCRKGFFNACVMLSRELDDHWEGDSEPLLRGPAQIGAEVYCCSGCNVEQSMTPIQCSGCEPLSANGPCSQPQTCGELTLGWDPSTQRVECRVPNYAGANSAR